MTEINRRSLIAAGVALAAAGPAADAKTPDDALFSAFAYLFTPFEFARLAQQARQRTGVNIVNHRRGFADAKARAVTTPNNDTLYSSCFLDLSGGPVLVDIPDVADRYVSVAFMDAFTNNFRILGTRASRGRGGKFLLALRGWRGPVPADAQLLACPTQDVWMLARILADVGDDLSLAHAIQDRLVISPTAGAQPPAPTEQVPGPGTDAGSFFDVSCAMLLRGARNNPDVARARRHRAFGVAPGATFAGIAPALRARWTQALPAGRARLAQGIEHGARVHNGWSTPQPHLGDFGDDDLFRAAVALGGIAALPPVEAMYLTASVDGAGAGLHGEHRYTWILPSGGVPVDAFWSLSMYQIEPDGRLFFAENTIGRFAIGDRTKGLRLEPDGSLSLTIQATPPPDPANSLPAPRGPFRLILRAYLPKPRLRKGAWTPPPVVRVG